MPDASQLTPMFRQYRSLKADHVDAILLFRMGDFYEMFYEDARDASRILELTLTARGKGTEHQAPMCGFPHHQVDSYAARLVRAGRRVAICEQMEDPRKAKGLVKREVIRVLTPGTITDPRELDAKANSWAAAVAALGSSLGAAFLDASTGEFLAWQAAPDAEPWAALADRLRAFAPREIVHPEGFPWPEALRREHAADSVLTECDALAFVPSGAEAILKRHLGVASLSGYGLVAKPAAVAAAGGLFVYLQESQKSSLRHIDGLALHEPSRFLLLDAASRRNRPGASGCTPQAARGAAREPRHRAPPRAVGCAHGECPGPRRSAGHTGASTAGARMPQRPDRAARTRHERWARSLRRPRGAALGRAGR
jgi:DNA mismatch repair protein MutS